MLTTRFISRLTLAAILLAGGAALPTVALAHDNDHRDRGGYHNRDRHDDHRGKHERRWEDKRRWDRHDRHHRHVYERRYVAPPVRYAPLPVFPRPGNGVTVILRNQW